MKHDLNTLEPGEGIDYETQQSMDYVDSVSLGGFAEVDKQYGDDS